MRDEPASRAQGDPRGPIRAAVQERMRATERSSSTAGRGRLRRIVHWPRDCSRRRKRPAVSPRPPRPPRPEDKKSGTVTTVKKLFSPSLWATAPRKESQEARAPGVPSAPRDRLTRDFLHFLRPLQKIGQEDLSPEELSECVQDFYQSLADRLLSHFKGSTDSVERVMEEVEKYVMTRLHQAALCPQTAEDQRKDLALHTRIR
ncbi:hypothetical protein COCON_G00184540 [Conger conger]|uniref:RABX5 catalytic core helical domain-containing protein n=1 Tax=Conger conger TaxID=82655 RepID=A0A9Q1D2L8_CONCO|nr:hypothetical protein COCON_G00184540 [Conger conger]